MTEFFCVLTVCLLRCRRSAISPTYRPDTNSRTTSLSRRVSVRVPVPLVHFEASRMVRVVREKHVCPEHCRMHCRNDMGEIVRFAQHPRTPVAAMAESTAGLSIMVSTSTRTPG